MKKERLCNLEVLRVLSMFLVMLVHYNVPINGLPSPAYLQDNPIKVLGILELQSLDIVCVNCFILISGYFGIRWKLRSIMNFIFQVIFWVLFSYIFACAISYQNFSLGGLTSNLIHSLSYNWFIVSYLGLYLFAPVLNKYIDSSSPRELVRFTFLFYLFQTVFGYLLRDAIDFHDGCTILSIVGLYFLGTCVRRIDTKYFKFNKYVDLSIYLLLGLGLTLISVITLSLGISKSVYGYMNPIVLAQSMYLFLFFTKIKVRAQWVMFFSSSAFAIYLFHYNPNIYPSYLDACRWMNGVGGFLGILCLLTMIYILVTLVDKFRSRLFDAVVGKHLS